MTRRVTPAQEAEPTQQGAGADAAASNAGNSSPAAAVHAITARQVLSNLPDQLPVSRDEIDLLRVYFADLITAALKDSP